MKFKFFLGIGVSVIVGFFVSIGVLTTSTVAINYIKSQSYALYENVSDLGAKEIYEIEEKDVSEELESDEQDSQTKNKYFLFRDSAPFPEITSQAFLVADLDTGKIIKQENRDEIYPIASLTKFLTALVSLETLDQEEETMVSYRALSTYGKQGNLYSGQKIKVGDLLYPLLLESSNDASEVIAEFGDRRVFMENMNGKARSIGLLDTSVADPSGLSAFNVSTADDLFGLVQYIYKREPKILEITKLKDYENFENKWFSNSRFRNDERYYGGKNGYIDESLHTLISVFDLPLVEDVEEDESRDRRIAIILLKGMKTEGDTRAIISWLLNNVYYQ